MVWYTLFLTLPPRARGSAFPGGMQTMLGLSAVSVQPGKKHRHPILLFQKGSAVAHSAIHTAKRELEILYLHHYQ